MRKLEMLTEAGITLPFMLSREKHQPLMLKAFEENRLMRQNQDPKVSQGPGQYRSPYGPCVVGCILPDALAEWIDAGHSQEGYTVSQMLECGVFSVSTGDEADWFIKAQAAHDAGSEQRLKQLGEQLADFTS